jgi:hypothetical protein
MKNTERLDEEILGYVRQNLGIEKDDTSKDDLINEMDNAEILDRVATWNNLIRYGGTIIDWVERVFDVQLT